MKQQTKTMILVIAFLSAIIIVNYVGVQNLKKIQLEAEVEKDD